MTEPTLAAIPGILLRTVLRAIARAILTLAGLCLLLGLALTFVSLLVATWRTPRTSKVQRATELLVAATALVKEFRV